MKKVLLVLALVLLMSCEKEDITIYQGYFPECSMEEFEAFNYEGISSNVTIEFVGPIYHEDVLQGYKWKIINGTDRRLINLEVDIVEGNEDVDFGVDLFYSLNAKREVFIFTTVLLPRFRVKYIGYTLNNRVINFRTTEITFNNDNRINACFLQPVRYE
jgi:hypothetical protein